MLLNKELSLALPKFEDTEKNPITVVQTLPSFVTFDNAANVYTLKPVDPTKDLGVFLIKGSLSDSQLSTPF